ncbi:hypothetical protein SAMN05216459_12815 [Ensifer sp. OV372]|nr:hypothetical protein SAMN05216459_12815 [Ensifer sp. OV372]
MRTGSTRSRKTSEAPGSSRREEPRARLTQKNEEYRRNQHSGARRARFREFSSCGGREKSSRRSLNIEARRGGGTDCTPRLAHDRPRACLRNNDRCGGRQRDTDRCPRLQLEKDGHGVSCMHKSLRQNGGSALTRPSCAARAGSRPALASSSSVSICRRSPVQTAFLSSASSSSMCCSIVIIVISRCLRKMTSAVVGRGPGQGAPSARTAAGGGAEMRKHFGGTTRP